MEKDKADQLYKEIVEELEKRHDKKNLDPQELENLKKSLYLIPADSEGNRKITYGVTGKIYLVPVKHIILNGIEGKDLNKFPEEK